MKYFTNIKTVEELKKAYFAIAKKYHPDMGGSVEIMKEINNEYETLFAKVKDIHTSVKEDSIKREVNKMRDIYLMNKETGEIVPSKDVFREFYKNHGIYDSVFDEWVETDLEVDDSVIDFPNLADAISL